MLFDLPASERPRLIGIARLAAESERLEAKRRVEYFELTARSYITRCSSPRMPFRWTINPYRGCEFGCKYCYARYAHEFMELREPAAFEQKIYVKQFSVEVFRRELARIPRDEAIAIGTATDPYQPAERRYGVTRRILEELSRERGRHLSITTKSDAVARDVELLRGVARGNVLCVTMTVTTVDEDLARMVEPMAPRPALRLAAVRTLAGAGIEAGVFASPIMPLINDRADAILALARAAREADARFFSGSPLFLKPCSYRVFVPFLEARFPHLARRYRERYRERAYLSGEYPEIIRKRIAEARGRVGLQRAPVDYQPELWAGEPQLVLPLDQPFGTERINFSSTSTCC